MVDRDLILRKVAALDEYVVQLSEYRTLTAEAYRGDWKTQRIVERTLQIALETCADMAHHFIADRRLRPPSTYVETFEVLAEAGLLEVPLRDSLVRMMKFRNILVHGYARIDANVVTGILREQLGDFERFKGAVIGWLGRAPRDSDG